MNQLLKQLIYKRAKTYKQASVNHNLNFSRVHNNKINFNNTHSNNPKLIYQSSRNFNQMIWLCSSLTSSFSSLNISWTNRFHSRLNKSPNNLKISLFKHLRLIINNLNNNNLIRNILVIKTLFRLSHVNNSVSNNNQNIQFNQFNNKWLVHNNLKILIQQMVNNSHQCLHNKIFNKILKQISINNYNLCLISKKIYKSPRIQTNFISNQFNKHRHNPKNSTWHPNNICLKRVEEFRILKCLQPKLNLFLHKTLKDNSKLISTNSIHHKTHLDRLNLFSNNMDNNQYNMVDISNSHSLMEDNNSITAKDSNIWEVSLVNLKCLWLVAISSLISNNNIHKDSSLEVIHNNSNNLWLSQDMDSHYIKELIISKLWVWVNPYEWVWQWVNLWEWAWWHLGKLISGNQYQRLLDLVLYIPMLIQFATGATTHTEVQWVKAITATIVCASSVMVQVGIMKKIINAFLWKLLLTED